MAYKTKLANTKKEINDLFRVKIIDKTPKPKSDFDKIMSGEPQNAGQILDLAHKVQDDNDKTIKRIIIISGQIESTGISVAETLEKQKESLSDLNKDLDKMQSNTNRAKNELMWFARQMAGDKCFLCILAMIILCIIVLVFWIIYKKRT